VVDNEKIQRTADLAQGVGPSGTEGDDVAATRNPDAIAKEIEQTRAELADTIDAIADRISPKRAASRSAAAVKAQVSGVFAGHGNGSAPASVLDAPAQASGHLDSQRRQHQVRAISDHGGGAAYAGSAQFAVSRRLRTDRVLWLVGAGAAIAGLVVLRRSRG
jgi:hypothetical protein